MLQILSVIYDDKLSNGTTPNDDDQNIFAPHVLNCDFANGGSDNVVESFAVTSKCHRDGPCDKDGVLHHTDPKHDMPGDTNVTSTEA